MGTTLDGAGIVRALVLASDAAPPDPVPASWREVPPEPFATFENGEPSSLPLELRGEGELKVEERSSSLVAVTIGDATVEVPRFWLARMLYRVALHGLRMGYAETYGGFFVDDREEATVRIGVRVSGGTITAMTVPRAAALRAVERLYRAVAPPGYRERPA